jgi:hypothetical protein
MASSRRVTCWIASRNLPVPGLPRCGAFLCVSAYNAALYFLAWPKESFHRRLCGTMARPVGTRGGMPAAGVVIVCGVPSPKVGFPIRQQTFTLDGP